MHRNSGSEKEDEDGDEDQDEDEAENAQKQRERERARQILVQPARSAKHTGSASPSQRAQRSPSLRLALLAVERLLEGLRAPEEGSDERLGALVGLLRALRLLRGLSALVRVLMRAAAEAQVDVLDPFLLLLVRDLERRPLLLRQLLFLHLELLQAWRHVDEASILLLGQEDLVCAEDVNHGYAARQRARPARTARAAKQISD